TLAPTSTVPTGVVAPASTAVPGSGPEVWVVETVVSTVPAGVEAAAVGSAAGAGASPPPAAGGDAGARAPGWTAGPAGVVGDADPEPVRLVHRAGCGDFIRPPLGRVVVPFGCPGRRPRADPGSRSTIGATGDAVV